MQHGTHWSGFEVDWMRRNSTPTPCTFWRPRLGFDWYLHCTSEIWKWKMVETVIVAQHRAWFHQLSNFWFSFFILFEPDPFERHNCAIELYVTVHSRNIIWRRTSVKILEGFCWKKRRKFGQKTKVGHKSTSRSEEKVGQRSDESEESTWTHLVWNTIQVTQRIIHTIFWFELHRVGILLIHAHGVSNISSVRCVFNCTQFWMNTWGKLVE